MSGNWKLNINELTHANVRIIPTSFTYGQDIRQAFTPIESGDEHRERKGRNLVRMSIQISFMGVGEDKFDELADMLDEIDTDDVWTLEAPSAYEVYVYKNFKRAAFSTTRYNVDLERSIGKITAKIDAVMNGVWIADGGTYCEEISGWFDYDGTDYTLNSPVHLPNEHGDNTGTAPLVKLPEQGPGYPRGIRASDFAEVEIPGPFSEDGFIVGEGGGIYIYENYDLTGFLIPAPTAAGDTGVFQICSSPAASFLDGNSIAGDSIGIGGLAIAEGYIGE